MTDISVLLSLVDIIYDWQKNVFKVFTLFYTHYSAFKKRFINACINLFMYAIDTY